MEYGKELVAEHLVKNKMPKLDLGGAIDGMMDFNSKLDEIAKDIRDRKDNAMAMEFVKVIGEMLEQNGVSVKIEEYSDKTMGTNKIEVKYGVRLVGIDFSEHDMELQNEIEKLKAEISAIRRTCLSETELHLFDAKSFYRLRIISKDAMKDTIALKQRIAELESEKAEKPTKINLNDRVKVKLTPLGAEIYYHQYDDLNKSIKANGGTQLEPRMPRIDKDGYTEFTLHHFINLYGEHIGMCKPNVIEPINIELC